MNQNSQLIDFINNHDNTTTFPDLVTFVNETDNPHFTVQYNASGSRSMVEPKPVPFTYTAVAEFEDTNVLFERFAMVRQSIAKQKLEFEQYRLEDGFIHKLFAEHHIPNQVQFKQFIKAIEHEKASRDIYTAAANILSSEENIQARTANQISNISNLAYNITNISNELVERYTPRMRRRGVLTLDKNLIQTLIQ